MNSGIYQKVYNMMLEMENTNTEKNPLKNEKMILTQNIFATLTGAGCGKLKEFIKNDPGNVRGFLRNNIGETKSIRKYLQNGDFYLMSKFKKKGADDEADSPEVKNLPNFLEFKLGHKIRG